MQLVKQVLWLFPAFNYFIRHLHYAPVDKALESFVQTCQSLWNKVTPTPLHPWSWPSTPWHRVHVDFAGLFMEQQFLIMVDAHSKWSEVIPMTVTSAEKTVRRVIATHGLPCQIVSDNGVQFTSAYFQNFLNKMESNTFVQPHITQLPMRKQNVLFKLSNML